MAATIEMNSAIFFYNYQDEDGDSCFGLWIYTSFAAQILGLSESQLNNYHKDNPKALRKMRNPNDRRRYVYFFEDLVEIVRTFPTDANPFRGRDPLALDAQGEPVKETDKRIFKTIKELYERDREKLVRRGQTYYRPAHIDEVIKMLAEAHQHEDPNHLKVIGDDVPSLRASMTSVMGVTDQEKPRGFDMLVRQVGCFGFLDESNEECANHCKLAPWCAQKRNDYFSQLARQIEDEEAQAMKLDDLERLLEEQAVRVGDLDEDLDDWLDL